MINLQLFHIVELNLSNFCQLCHWTNVLSDECVHIVYKVDLWVCVTGVLEIRTVSEGGVLAIKGLKSQYYISMNRMGILQGKVNINVCLCKHTHTSSAVISWHFYLPQKEYNDSCNFKEVFLENYYTAYASVKWTKNGKEMFISLSQKGRPLKGKKTRKESVASHFIPRKCREDEKTLA